MKRIISMVGLLATLFTICVVASQTKVGSSIYKADAMRRVEPVATSRAQATVYELRCRGRQDAFGFEDSGVRKQLTGGQTIIVLHLNFKAAQRAASSDGRGLDPGTCSWIDRPLNSREPRQIWLETVDNAQLKQTLQGTAVDRSATAAEKYPDMRTIPVYLNDPNHYWSFFVVNSERGYFAAQSHKYWKRSLADSIATERRGADTRISSRTTDSGVTSGPGARRNSSRIAEIRMVTGKIRWKKEYGVLPMYAGSNEPYAIPCGQFFAVAVTVGPRIGKVRYQVVGNGTLPNKAGSPSEEGDYYVCSYAITGLPKNQSLLIMAGLGGILRLPQLDPAPLYHTLAWVSGTQPAPPAGYERMFTGSRSVTLTDENPQAEVDFEMVYAPQRSTQPSMPR